MNYWLMKTEPGNYSWEDLVKDKETYWDGVRNYQARNHMKNMKVGDLVLYYHSVDQKSVVGVARIVKEFYPDPTIDDDKWVAVDIVPEYPLKKNITLSEIKSEPRLKDMVLVRNMRLSVQPVKPEEFDVVIELSERA